MRHVAWALGLMVGLVAVGCSNTRFGQLRNPNTAGNQPMGRPTAEGLVAYLKSNSDQIRSLQCDKVEIDYQQGLQSFHTDAKITCQKPRNFRLGAFAYGGQQVDMGSNSEEFWYWIAKADPPYVYRCAYQDFERGVALPFPFQPEWIMEALGMGEYGPADKYRLVEQKNTWDLVETASNSQGQQVRKVTEFGKRDARLQVRGYKLVDARGKEIYTAQVDDVWVIGGAVVPRKVTLNWPDQKMSMTLRMGRGADQVVLNAQIPPERAAVLFSRSTLNNIQTVDLAEVSRRAAGGIQPAGGAMR